MFGIGVDKKDLCELAGAVAGGVGIRAYAESAKLLTGEEAEDPEKVKLSKIGKQLVASLVIGAAGALGATQLSGDAQSFVQGVAQGGAGVAGLLAYDYYKQRQKVNQGVRARRSRVMAAPIRFAPASTSTPVTQAVPARSFAGVGSVAPLEIT